jgi:hypothetical protein
MHVTDGFGFLVSSAANVGWHAGFGLVPYFEFSLDGKTMTEYPGVLKQESGEVLTGLAITDSGDVFATVSVFLGDSQPHGDYLYYLDRERKQWLRVPWPAAPSGPAVDRLLGGTGNELVFATRDKGVCRVIPVRR